MNTPASARLEPRLLLLITLMLLAAFSRLIPHPPNFAPIGALALFGGACFASRRLAVGLPLLAMLLSDLALGLLAGHPLQGFHALMPFVYGSFALSVGLGIWLRKHQRAVLPLAAATLTGSVLFFAITNFGVWLTGYYGYTWQGLGACYLAAVPFFHNTLLGDAVYVSALFGGLALAEAGIPSLREAGLAEEALG